MIEQTKPLIGENEQKAVDEYLKSGGWITEFKKTEEFELRLASFLGVKHCIVVPSGTIALALACMVFKNEKKKKVLVPDMSMIATANAVLLAGMEVEFCDVADYNNCIDYGILSKYFGRDDIAGIIHVSFNGRGIDLDIIAKECKRYGWFFIEDACQAFGSKFDGKYLGTYGDIGCFSLSPHKIITTGQGGFLVTNNDFHAMKLRHLKDFGRRKPGIDDHIDLGFNFKFTDLQAVVGLAQLEGIYERIQRKKEIYDRYYEKLANGHNLHMILRDEDHVPWFVDLYTNVDFQPNYLKEHITNALNKDKIGYRPMYPPMHTQAPYRAWGSYPISEQISRDGLWLPSHLELTNEQIDTICNCILNA